MVKQISKDSGVYFWPLSTYTVLQNSCLPKGMDHSRLYSSLRFQPVPSHFVPIKDIESKILSGIL